jgi:L-alanine-DL-glutamate epimerase-like enolase superfamily enzyme
MPTSDPTITRVELVDLPTRYPRTVGRNARLGSHDSGGISRVAVLSTDTARTGWGLVEQTPAGDWDGLVVGRALSELIDPGTGIREQALGFLDVPLHDLLGQVLDQPVHALLGSGGETIVEVYDGAIYFDDLDPDDDPRGGAVLLDQCHADAALGYRAFKLKIGRGHRWLDLAAGDRRDIEITRAVRDAFPTAKILVDANDGYDLDGIRRYLEAVADVGLYWVEEPFTDDAGDLAELRAHLDAVSPATLIAEGETDPDVASLLPIAGRGHLDVLLMDVMSFGLTPWRRITPTLVELGVSASPHAWGRPLKTIYAAHLAAGLGNVAIVEGVPGATDGVDTSAHVFADGRLALSERPGFGLPVPRT